MADCEVVGNRQGLAVCEMQAVRAQMYKKVRSGVVGPDRLVWLHLFVDQFASSRARSNRSAAEVRAQRGRSTIHSAVAGQNPARLQSGRSGDRNAAARWQRDRSAAWPQGSVIAMQNQSEPRRTPQPSAALTQRGLTLTAEAARPQQNCNKTAARCATHSAITGRGLQFCARTMTPRCEAQREAQRKPQREQQFEQQREEQREQQLFSVTRISQFPSSALLSARRASQRSAVVRVQSCGSLSDCAAVRATRCGFEAAVLRRL